jgi:hypothetical protein
MGMNQSPRFIPGEETKNNRRHELDDMLRAIPRDLTSLRPGRAESHVKKCTPKNYRLTTRPRKEMGPLPHRKVGVENYPNSPTNSALFVAAPLLVSL